MVVSIDVYWQISGKAVAIKIHSSFIQIAWITLSIYYARNTFVELSKSTYVYQYEWYCNSQSWLTYVLFSNTIKKRNGVCVKETKTRSISRRQFNAINGSSTQRKKSVKGAWLLSVNSSTLTFVLSVVLVVLCISCYSSVCVLLHVFLLRIDVMS